jgi:hypothetical protein
MPTLYMIHLSDVRHLVALTFDRSSPIIYQSIWLYFSFQLVKKMDLSISNANAKAKISEKQTSCYHWLTQTSQFNQRVSSVNFVYLEFTS